MGGKGKGKGGKRFFDRGFFNNASNRDNHIKGPLPLYPEDLLMRTTLAEHLGNEKTGGSYLDPLLQFPLQYRALDAEPVPGIPGADHVLRSGLVNKIPKQEGASVGEVGEFLSDDDEGEDEEGDADNRITSAALSKANGAAKRFYFHDIRERVRRNYRDSYNSYSSHNVGGGAGAGGGAANRLPFPAMGGMYNATEIASAIAAGRGIHSPGEGVSAVNSGGTTGGGVTRGAANNDDGENSNQKLYLPASYFEEMRARSLFVGAEFFPQELLEPARPKASGSKRRRKQQHQQETTNMDEEQQQGSSDERNGSGSSETSETSDDEEKSKSGSGLGSDGELGEEDDDMFGDEDYLDGFADADANDFGEVEDAGGDVYDD